MPTEPDDVTKNLDLRAAVEVGAATLQNSVMGQAWAGLTLEEQDLWRAESELVVRAAAPLLARQVADAVTMGILESVGTLLAVKESGTLTSIHADGHQGSQRHTAPAEVPPVAQAGGMA